MRSILLFCTFFVVFLSCSKIERIIVFQDFNPLEDSAYLKEITVNGEIDYFEFRWSSSCSGPHHYEKVYSEGSKCAPEFDEATCIEMIDSAYSGEGFHYGCLPACCFNYFVSRSGTDINLHTTTESVISLLDPIDTYSDALMVAFSAGYSFKPDEVGAGGYKKEGDNFQLIVIKLVEFCTPIQYNRYLLEINPHGEIEILETDVYSRDRYSCI